MKVILSGGGTGGHIYPALTIADQIKKLQPEAEVSFVGTRQGLEKDIIPRYKTMKGYHVLRKAGWDTHGLPVELEVEKQLHIDG